MDIGRKQTHEYINIIHVTEIHDDSFIKYEVTMVICSIKVLNTCLKDPL